ncbi:hypothetical protein NDU88_005222 [Pleurodeles waltl]|uniref:Uncharacterized protein n=1 Tax=Pleurodeles waltl TaxID=8319 RepID=A0AAV7LNH8_PLEWA|nr:hypothetical protein NDU88_005222 [Pleurodeles waltl]
MDDDIERAVHIMHAIRPGGHPRKRILKCNMLLAGQPIRALINTGASINIMVQSLYQRSLNEQERNLNTSQEEEKEREEESSSSQLVQQLELSSAVRGVTTGPEISGDVGRLCGDPTESEVPYSRLCCIRILENLLTSFNA